VYCHVVYRPYVLQCWLSSLVVERRERLTVPACIRIGVLAVAVCRLTSAVAAPVVAAAAAADTADADDKDARPAASITWTSSFSAASAASAPKHSQGSARRSFFGSEETGFINEVRALVSLHSLVVFHVACVLR
jgi:hypothetical protein